MKIYQIVFSLAYGDAIGNDVLAMNEVIKELGYATGIYASVIDSRLSGMANYLDTLNLEDEDIVIYHKASGGPLSDYFRNLKCYKIMLYHNITPHIFFKPYSRYKSKRLEQGRVQLKSLVGHVDYCLADSEYNKEELVEIGFEPSKIDVLPIIMNYEDYQKEPSLEIFNKYNDGNANLLFTGRIAPNKKQEDLIKAFYYYKKFKDKNSRLFIVGSYDGCEKYYAKLKGFVADLKLEDVYFTGHIPFNEILAYYKVANAFICMSEHEGFCVPLIESMYFGVPIIAYNSSAIPHTLGQCGVLVDNKDFIEISDIIEKIVKDKSYREQIINGQYERLKFFSRENSKNIFRDCIQKFIKTYYKK